MSIVHINKYNKNLIGLYPNTGDSSINSLVNVTKGNHLFYEGGGLNYERIMQQQAFRNNRNADAGTELSGINFSPAVSDRKNKATASYIRNQDINRNIVKPPVSDDTTSWWENNGDSTIGYAADAAADLMSIKENGLHNWAESESGTDKILNDADPLHWIADGRSNKTGNILSKTGNSVFMSGVKQGNPFVMLGGAAIKIGGGLVNTIGGWKTDEAAQQRLSDLEQRAENYRTQAYQVGSNEDLYNLNMDFSGASLDPSKYKGGWTSRSKRKAEEQFRKDQARETRALAMQASAYNQATSNVNNNQNRLMFSNYYACGGKIKKFDEGGATNNKSTLKHTTLFEDVPKLDPAVQYWIKEAYPNIKEDDYASDGYPNLLPKDMDKRVLQFMIDDGTFDKRMGFDYSTPKNKRLEAMGRKRIGYGNRKDYVTRLLTEYPHLYDDVVSNAEQYNLNPNIIFQKLAHEGIYDSLIGNIDDPDFADPFDPDINYHSTYDTWGLDDLFTNKDKLNIKNPKLQELLNDDHTFTVENEKGREIKAAFIDYNTGVSATAAMLDKFRNEIKHAYPDMDDKQLDIATSIAFNRGLEGAKKFIGNDPSKYNFGDYNIYDYVGAVNKHKYGGYTKGNVYELTDAQYKELIKQGFELEII